LTDLESSLRKSPTLDTILFQVKEVHIPTPYFSLLSKMKWVKYIAGREKIRIVHIILIGNIKIIYKFG